MTTEKQAKQPKEKLDLGLLVEGLSQGMTHAQAAKHAGSTAKSRNALSGVASQALRRHPELREDVLESMKNRRIQAVQSLSKQKMDKASAKDLAIVVGILTEKINLMEGKPTQRVEGSIDFSKKKPSEVKGWLISKIKQS